MFRVMKMTVVAFQHNALVADNARGSVDGYLGIVPIEQKKN